MLLFRSAWAHFKHSVYSYGQGSFIDRFGSKVAGTNEKEISAPWQSGLSNAALCGEIIGLAINGWASERFGYRYVSDFAMLSTHQRLTECCVLCLAAAPYSHRYQ